MRRTAWSHMCAHIGMGEAADAAGRRGMAHEPGCCRRQHGCVIFATSLLLTVLVGADIGPEALSAVVACTPQS